MMHLYRLAAPALAFLAAALVLCVWRRMPRWRAPPPARIPPGSPLAARIRAHASLARRTRRLETLRAALRRALHEAACRSIPGYADMTPAERARILARGTGIDAATLRTALEEATVASVSEHRAAITLLEALRRMLLEGITPGRRRA